MRRALLCALLTGCASGAATDGKPPVEIRYLSTRGGKPPLRFVKVELTMTNRRDEPLWFITRYYGDQALQGEPFKGDRRDRTPMEARASPGRGGGRTIELRFYGPAHFRACRLPPGGVVRYEAYSIDAWSDIREFEVWEVRSISVNGTTPLETWLPYKTMSDGDVVVPEGAESQNLNWDPARSRPRDDLPSDPVEFISTDVVKKWIVPIEGAP